MEGVIGRLGEPNRTALRRMNDAMAHHGPDGEGFWEAAPGERGWAPMLAHRRLSILDLAPSASHDELAMRAEISLMHEAVR